jgi:hypothetical protein
MNLHIFFFLPKTLLNFSQNEDEIALFVLTDDLIMSP